MANPNDLRCNLEECSCEYLHEVAGNSEPERNVVVIAAQQQQQCPERNTTEQNTTNQNVSNVKKIDEMPIRLSYEDCECSMPICANCFVSMPKKVDQTTDEDTGDDKNKQFLMRVDNRVTGQHTTKK